jgi:hypothetical protein
VADTEPIPEPHVFERAEAELLELARALDRPVRLDRFALAVLGLGVRSATLFRAVTELQRGRAPAAAQALIRPLVEINILIRFLGKSPELHTELWEAEGTRNAITIAEEISQSAMMATRWPRHAAELAGLSERRREVDDAREKARAAGVNGVGSTGAVFPSIAAQLVTIADPAADEAYTLGYRILSWDVHGGPHAFATGVWLETEDGRRSFEDSVSPEQLAGARALAIATLGSTLKLCGLYLDRPHMIGPAETIQRLFVPQPDPSGPGGTY